MVLVSVIIPYFKKKLYFKKTFNSVISQNFKNFEIIIIYDDSDLMDLQFIRKIIKGYKNVKIIINPKQLGAGGSRNMGVKSAKGKFIAFIDADDLWKNNKLKLQLKFMIKNKCSISHTSYNIIKGNKVISSRVAKDFIKFEDLLKSCNIGLSTVILKKSIFKGKIKFPNLKTKEDFVLWLNLLKQNYRICGIKSNLAYWRKLDNSLSSFTIQKLKDGFRVYNKYMGFNFIKSFFYLFILSINYLKKK
jgi:teichuronic acid biosynthesis glycosyltransferase TuaG